MKKKISVVVGPTASGKSAFSLRLAEKIKGSIINADSMQIYKDLTVLTARPTPAEMNNIPHYLYGYLDSFQNSTVFDWLKLAVQKIKEVNNPIVTGGTGMYIQALVEGISPMPDVDLDIRKKVRDMPLKDVQKMVIDCSAVDSQRLRRALEIQLTTGKPISYFQNLPKEKLIDADFTLYFINPPRTILYNTCNLRFENMLAQGALDEVKHLISIQARNGVRKAIGVPEIESYLKGEILYKDMIEKAKTSTRHYAKRQVTWFKHQLRNKIEIENPMDFDFK